MIYSNIEPDRPQIAEIVHTLGKAIQSVGTETFATHFAALMLDSFKVTEFFVFQRGCADESAPVPLFAKSRDDQSADRVRAYCGGFYREDPIYQVLNSESVDGVYALRVRVDEIHNAHFRKICYSQTGFTEKLTLAAKSDNEIIALSVYCREADGGFPPSLAADLSHFGNLILPLLALHYRLIGNSERQRQVSAKDMEDCVSWACPELTKREVAVCARSILGVTSEGIALDLGIKQTSVLTYRRRAYARLNINSINQLSTMLIQSSAARQLAAA